uniref:GPI transamidase component PIG-U n=1 Tax=Chaetoceros debilis TaxID=122233 RepID=A0A7S3PTX3_9STRA|mmetsp:Transcript_2427/g.3627  ORF Transcript_2427/g.3627 Transcript_2427/m.3627 type:complete len:497 (+) Transcript_2427:216-1706(+)|eukprot:CAMPEP_0194084152 /NCGR_PEP_ID=MMETSP0149-20130528/11804_1 /TAXON_ID=122233 /ORGANISM="Chaetoceros debilis, Strain MM31A-1" /LENGTH=496 /DNA_ID=CAMNT_0038766721 /DNA_START=145 /DNA_END=1635 /DNA_ORIENTATION=-
MISISLVLFLGTAIRGLLLLDSFTTSILSKYFQSSALQSILYDPTYTLKSLKEAIFLSSVDKNGTVTSTLQFEFGNLHPMLLAGIDKLLKMIPSDVTIPGINVDISEEVVFAIAALIIDLFTALQLYRLAKAVFRVETDRLKFEKVVEQKMPPQIYPISHSRTFLFGLRFEDDAIFEPPLFSSTNVPILCTMMYYLNPFTILTSASGFPSIQGIWVLLFVSALVSSMTGNAIFGGFCVATLCHFDINYIVFLLPVALLWRSPLEFHSAEFKKDRPTIKLFLVSFFFWFGIANAPLLLTADPSKIEGDTLGDLVPTDRLTEFVKNFQGSSEPNLGMHWYLQINLFERFREYFAVITSSFLYLFIVPLYLRLDNYPMEMIISFQLLSTVLGSSPTTQDACLSLALMTLARRSIARMGYAALICLCALPVPIILYVTFYSMWLETGNGNANFLFFQCLAYNLFLGFITIDFIAATVKRDKALRVTAKKENITIAKVDSM